MLEPFCAQFPDAGRLSVQAIRPASAGLAEWSRIARQLALAMPSFGVSDYFAKKGALLKNSEIAVIVDDAAEDMTVGFLAASWSACEEPRFLYIRTLMIAEAWHRSSVIYMIYRQLFETLLAEGQPFPDAIVFKTYNPRSFAAIAAFRRVPGATIYPFIDGNEKDDALLPAIRRIAGELAPGCRLDEATGVLRGAAEGVTTFYRAMPLSGSAPIDDHFHQNLTPADRILACLFTGGTVGAARILRVFGVRQSGASNVQSC